MNFRLLGGKIKTIVEAIALNPPKETIEALLELDDRIRMKQLEVNKAIQQIIQYVMLWVNTLIFIINIVEWAIGK